MAEPSWKWRFRLIQPRGVFYTDARAATFKLKWSDFPNRPQPPGRKARAAVIAYFRFGRQDRPQLEEIPGTSKLRMIDNFTVTVEWVRNQSGRLNDDVPHAPDAQLLLDHEQGHLDITVLLARDYFSELMQLRKYEYNTREAGRSEAESILNRMQSALTRVQQNYDWQTDNGKGLQGIGTSIHKSPTQKKWEAWIKRAFKKHTPLQDVIP